MILMRRRQQGRRRGSATCATAHRQLPWASRCWHAARKKALLCSQLWA